MKKNLNNADRVIRIILAVIFAALYATNIIHGTIGLILVIFGAVLVVTSFISFCPIYWTLGWSTRHKAAEKSL